MTLTSAALAQAIPHVVPGQVMSAGQFNLVVDKVNGISGATEIFRKRNDGELVLNGRTTNEGRLLVKGDLVVDGHIIASEQPRTCPGPEAFDLQMDLRPGEARVVRPWPGNNSIRASCAEVLPPATPWRYDAPSSAVGALLTAAFVAVLLRRSRT